jgi:integrase/recombinase XerD
MGEFRDRMERDLRIRGFSSAPQRCYLARMKALVEFFMRPPDELTVEDIHAYQLHLTRDRKVGWSTFNQSVCAIRFFYGVTLSSAWDIQRIPYQKTGRTLPMVLSPEEVSKLFRIVTNLKHRVIPWPASPSPAHAVGCGGSAKVKGHNEDENCSGA